MPGPKVTIYFSVPHASDFAIIGRAELKAHIHTAVGLLQNLNTSAELSQIVLEKLRSLLKEKELWSQRSEGYAIFASASILRYYALPLPMEGKVWVNSDFHIVPLIPLLCLPEQFYLLEVSLGKPRMVRVHSQFSVPVSLERVWALEAARDNEDIVHNRAFHTSAASPASGGHGGMIPHGGSQDGEFRRREFFFKFLAQTVDEVLQHQPTVRNGVPLVITGTDELVAHFRKHLRYQNVLASPERIGIPDGDPLTLDTGTWNKCLHLYSDREASKTTGQDKLEELRSRGRVTEDLDKILSLSAAGGIMTLIVNEAALRTNGVESKEPDLVNAALVLTLQHHGEALTSSTLTSPAGVAALLRPGVTF